MSRIRHFLMLIILQWILTNPSFSQQQYFNGNTEMMFSPVPNNFVFQFAELDRQKKKNLLIELGIEFEEQNLFSKYVKIKSTKDINTLRKLKYSSIKSISQLYKFDSSDQEFTFFSNLLIRFKKETTQDIINALISNHNLKRTEKELFDEKTFLFHVNAMPEEALRIANEIYATGIVNYSNPDITSFNTAESNDTYYSDQWNLGKISISDAWNISTGSTSIRIAILDDGVDSGNDDLDDTILPGYNAINPSMSTEPWEDNNHGTSCAGIAAAETNNSEGIAGVGYDCKIIPVKIKVNQDITESDAVAGINWAYQQQYGNADILNCSWNMGHSQAVLNAITNAVTYGRNGKGCIVVKSAGNRGTWGGESNITFPGEHPKVITVGATNSADTRYSYSSYGSALDVVAPSGLVYDVSLPATDIEGSAGRNSNKLKTGESDYTDKDYTKWFSGTSGAAPQVAGLAGLILSVDNTLTEEQVRNIICHTADDKGATGWDKYYGWGRINAYSAVKCADQQFTTSGSLQNNENWWGAVTFTGNVTVPNGITLYISNGATINLNGHILQSTGGTITREESVTFNPVDIQLLGSGLRGQYLTIQTAINNATTNDYVKLAAGTYSGSLGMRAGIEIYGDEPDNTFINGNVVYNDVVNGTTGINYVRIRGYIRINRCGQFWIDNVDIINDDEDHPDIELYDSGDGSLWEVVSECASSTDELFYAHNNSYAEVSESSSFTGSEGDAIYTSTSSELIIEDTYFCDQTGYDICAVSNSYVDASYGWGDHNNIFSGPANNFIYGNVDVPTNYLTCGGLSKSNASETVKVHTPTNTRHNKIAGDDPGFIEYYDALESYGNVRQKIIDDRKLDKGSDPQKYEAEFDSTIIKYKQVVDKYPYSPSAKRALNGVIRCYWYLNKPEMVSAYINSLVNDPLYNDLKVHALNLLVPYHIYNKEYEKALQLSDNILLDLPEDDLACEVLYGKGLLYKYNLKNFLKAADVFNLVILKYPDNRTAHSAMAELKDMGYKINSGSSEITTSFSMQNYPNPFNPETQIEYALPEESRVVFEVYNVLGQKIATLLDAEKQAGQHILKWKGTNDTGLKVSAGIYFVRMRAGMFEKSIKVMLLP